jgi:hypothetical protein
VGLPENLDLESARGIVPRRKPQPKSEAEPEVKKEPGKVVDPGAYKDEQPKDRPYFIEPEEKKKQ